MTTTKEVGIFTEGQIIAAMGANKAKGWKPTRAIIAIDKLMPFLTQAEIEKLRLHMTLDDFNDPNLAPERRRELLDKMDVCPCCQRWLGHNRPPADDDGGDPQHWRQASLNFDGQKHDRKR